MGRSKYLFKVVIDWYDHLQCVLFLFIYWIVNKRMYTHSSSSLYKQIGYYWSKAISACIFSSLIKDADFTDPIPYLIKIVEKRAEVIQYMYAIDLHLYTFLYMYSWNNGFNRNESLYKTKKKRSIELRSIESACKLLMDEQAHPFQVVDVYKGKTLNVLVHSASHHHGHGNKSQM